MLVCVAKFEWLLSLSAKMAERKRAESSLELLFSRERAACFVCVLMCTRHTLSNQGLCAIVSVCVRERDKRKATSKSILRVTAWDKTYLLHAPNARERIFSTSTMRLFIYYSTRFCNIITKFSLII